MVAAGNPFRDALNYLRFLDFGRKFGKPKSHIFEVFGLGRPPPGPRRLKIVKIRPEICLQTNSQPEMPSESMFEVAGSFPDHGFPGGNRPKKNS